MFSRLIGPCLLIALALATPAGAGDPGPEGADLGSVAAALIQAPDQGLDIDPDSVRQALELARSGDPAGQAQGRDALIAEALRYARAQHGLRLAPGQFHPDWALRPAPYDAAADFNLAQVGGHVASWLQSLPPPDPAYATLAEAYVAYRAMAAQGGWPVVSGPLHPGDTGAQITALWRRLAAEDRALDPSLADIASYGAPLQAAVARAQARYGLTADGVAGPATLAALNIPLAERLEQMRANLERRRWMPRALPAMRAEVNIADASLALYAPGEAPLTMRIVVGKPAKPTPMFEDHIKAVVLNPPWNVPADIAAREIWPKIRRDPGYMAREGFVVRPGGGLQQLPGPRCALGAIKFDLSNPFGVYLHDTPAKSLFAHDMRALSHGCMRLEQPNLLAKRLLRGEAAWSDTAIDVALVTGKTVRATLSRPTPLYVSYWTAFVNDQGVNFRADLYGWDKDLAALLRGGPNGR